MRGLVVLLLACCALPVGAQARVGCRVVVLSQTDSLRAETYRSQGVRKTVIRRLATRGDSLLGASVCDSLVRVDTVTLPVRVDTLIRHDTVTVVRVDTVYVATPPRLDSIALSASHTTTPHWSTGALGAVDATGQATVCATVEVSPGVLHLGETAVQVTQIRPDSLAFVVRPERDGAGIWLLCEPITHWSGTHRLWPVQWVLARIRGVWQPIAHPVVP